MTDLTSLTPIEQALYWAEIADNLRAEADKASAERDKCLAASIAAGVKTTPDGTMVIKVSHADGKSLVLDPFQLKQVNPGIMERIFQARLEKYRISPPSLTKTEVEAAYRADLKDKMTAAGIPGEVKPAQIRAQMQAEAMVEVEVEPTYALAPVQKKEAVE